MTAVTYVEKVYIELGGSHSNFARNPRNYLLPQ